MHDFFKTQEDFNNQKAWSWLECTEDQIKNVIKEYKLEETDTYMLNIVWGIYKKTIEKVAIPSFSSYI